LGKNIENYALENLRKIYFSKKIRDFPKTKGVKNRISKIVRNYFHSLFKPLYG